MQASTNSSIKYQTSTIEHYLSLLSGSATEGYFAFFESPSRNAFFHPVSNKAEASVEVARRSATANVYVSCSLLREPPSSGRGSESDASSFRLLSLDFDIAGPAHAETALPASAADLWRLLDAAKAPEPTGVLKTGNGLLALWALEEPMILSTPADRAEAKALSKCFQGRLRHVAATEFGWKFDPTQDLARLLRIPGTFNRKDPTNPKPVTWEYQPNYIALEIARRFAAITPANKAMRSPSNGEQSALTKLCRLERQADESDADKSKASVVYQSCPAVAHAFDQAEGLPYPQWLAALSIVARCQNGREVAHEMSRADSRYERDTTDAKVDEVLQNMGPRTCAGMEDARFEQCSRCPLRFSSEIRGPLDVGKEDYLIAERKRLAVVTMEDVFYDLEAGVHLTHKAVNAELKSRVARRSQPADMLLRSKAIGRVRRTSYTPGEESLVFQTGSEAVLNTWVAGGVAAVPGEHKHIDAHLELLFPEPGERGHVLDVFAHLVQRPGQKVNHALMVRGIQGSGKSTLTHLMRGLVGEPNVKVVPGQRMGQRWQAGMVDCEALIIEEVDQAERREVYEAVKMLIADEFFDVEEKCLPFRVGRTPRIILMTSNHRNPLPLPDDDRRFYVTSYGDKKATSDVYSVLHHHLAEELSRFKGTLLARDIANFNPHSQPPTTEGKKEIVLNSTPAHIRQIQDWVDDGTLAGDLVNVKSLKERLVDGGYRLNLGNVAAALRALGAVPCTAQAHVGGQRLRLWAIRNHDQWANASGPDLARHWQFHPNA